MKSTRFFLVLLCFSVLPSTALAGSEALTADEVALEVYRHVHGLRVDKSVSKKVGDKVATLINRGRNGRVTVNTFESYLNSSFDDASIETKSLAVFQSGKQRGLGILMTSYQEMDRAPSVLMWLPALRKVRRFSAPAHDDFWAGSVMTFGEVFLRKPHHEKHEFLQRKTIDYCLNTLVQKDEKQLRKLRLPASDCRFKGREVYQLKSTTKFESWWYDYHLTDVDVETFLPYKTVYFKNGQSVKTIEIAWRRGTHTDPLVHYPHFIFAQMSSNGFESLFYIPEETIEWHVNLPDRFWSERTLRKIKR